MCIEYFLYITIYPVSAQGGWMHYKPLLFYVGSTFKTTMNSKHSGCANIAHHKPLNGLPLIQIHVFACSVCGACSR